MPGTDAPVLARHDGNVDRCRDAPCSDAKISAAGIDSPELDARVLLCHALSLDHAAMAAAGERSLNAREQEKLWSWRGGVGTRTDGAHRRQQGILEPEARR